MPSRTELPRRARGVPARVIRLPETQGALTRGSTTLSAPLEYRRSRHQANGMVSVKRWAANCRLGRRQSFVNDDAPRSWRDTPLLSPNVQD